MQAETLRWVVDLLIAEEVEAVAVETDLIAVAREVETEEEKNK